MKRLAIITVGKTHSGKSTFAKALEKELSHSFILDQDNHAEFIHTYYKKLQPKVGPNTLKHSISKLIVDYAKDQTDFHIIVCNANRTRSGRKYLLDEIYGKNEFIRILIHFDIDDEILLERVSTSNRSTNIFRGNYSDFKEVLIRQQSEDTKEDIVDPEEKEADYLFEIRNNEDVKSVIKRIVRMSKDI